MEDNLMEIAENIEVVGTTSAEKMMILRQRSVAN